MLSRVLTLCRPEFMDEHHEDVETDDLTEQCVPSLLP